MRMRLLVFAVLLPLLFTLTAIVHGQQTTHVPPTGSITGLNFNPSTRHLTFDVTAQGDVTRLYVRAFDHDTGVQLTEDVDTPALTGGHVDIDLSSYPNVDSIQLSLLARGSDSNVRQLDTPVLSLAAARITPTPEATRAAMVAVESDVSPLSILVIVVVFTVLFAVGIGYFWLHRSKSDGRRAAPPARTIPQEVQAVIDASSPPVPPTGSAEMEPPILPFAERHEVTATMPAVRAAQDAEMLAEQARVKQTQANQTAESVITVFVSYQRTTSALLATLIANFFAAQGIKTFVDTLSINEAGQLSSLIERNIEACDVFIALVNGKTFESAWVKQEIALAVRLNKPMIPVYHQGYRPTTTGDEALDSMIVRSAGVKIDDVDNQFINESLTRLATMIRNSSPPDQTT